MYVWIIQISIFLIYWKINKINFIVTRDESLYGQRLKYTGQQVDEKKRAFLNYLLLNGRFHDEKKNTFKTLNELMKKEWKNRRSLGSLIIILPAKKLRLFTSPRSISRKEYHGPFFLNYFFVFLFCFFFFYSSSVA